MKLLKNFMLCSLILVFPIEATVTVRGAFDVGSNETKLRVAAVDEETNKIKKVYYDDVREVSLRGALAKSEDGNLSQEIQDKLIEAIHQLIKESTDFHPQQFFGIGTSIFRTAKNGQSVLDLVKEKTGVTIHLAPQEEEGSIGFLSAVAESQKNPEAIICWDLGAGSFQMTAMIDEQIVMYGNEFAFVPAYQILFNMRGIKPISRQVNPVHYDEMMELSSKIQQKLPSCPEWLLQENREVIGIGGHTSLFAIGKLATGKNPYTKENLKQAMSQYAGKSDQELHAIFPKAHEVAVGLTLLYAMMDHCKIDQVTYQYTNGGCGGVLLMPHYWQ